jgi:hypothetical protein
MCCDWADVVNVKCDLQHDGTVRRVQGKVQCSAIGSCSAVVSVGCHSSIKKNISHCVLLSSDNKFSVA